MLNGHGDDLHLVDQEIQYNFSSNVFYKGCPNSILNELSKQIASIQNYPSPSAEELSDSAAQKYNLAPSNFLFTNGAIEAFYLIAQHFRTKEASIIVPTFSEYEDACRIHDINYQLIDRNEIYHKVKGDLCFICNPNNPTGEVFSLQELEQLFIKYPKVIFIIDEAYIEFTTATESCLSFMNNYDNLVIVRSLTKTFCIPGLRLGYIIASSKLIEEFKNIRIPWSVNGLAIKIGQYLFKHYNQLLFNIDELIAERKVFQEQLSHIDYLKVIETNTTYFLIQLKKGKAKDLKAYLIHHGVLIRDATNFTNLDGEFIRLSVQKPEANQALIHLLSLWNIK
ncbi:pyridoxal phosphate-dependent aminotransferase [Flammeovirga pacifica]|uniref:Aminotransferase class I/classII large domain-containing protein n=1 Tax=Flammeovirga pacifica TaxID=915059 RepID=A0A1S1YY62_FLAPC|nr:aminotransferase class I/II-fold pyridoxal phosphate-dependent enzyme [Flammeovirga pacifica]OHX65873.1 hypothetical protein NH26_05660 [Flammeovirga pacifica]